jgi:exodeoxyribonuclease V alpha subunit
VHGGVKFYRGAARAARAYVERDRSRADDYYLAEGTGVAERVTATPAGVTGAGSMDSETYERWVVGIDLETGVKKGRLRTDAQGLRFVEVIVNGPKTWSLAAALHPEITAALDAAQGRAAEQVVGWVAEHATTRVGPRGRQVQVPVEQIEAAVIRHYTSRAGDPHRHLHLQINARVFAAGAWRGLHSVGIRDSIEAINGIGHAAVAIDPGFRAVLARHGFTLDPETSEIDQLRPYVGAFSARTAQIHRNIDRYEARWRSEHPDEEPGPKLREIWDRRAWAEARPDKVVPTSGADLVRRWNDDLRDLGYRDPECAAALGSVAVGSIERDAVADLVISQLGAHRSAWNTADIRGKVEIRLARLGVITDAAVRIELAEDLTSRATDRCTRLLVRSDVPEHVRALTSPRVLEVEADIVRRLAARATRAARGARFHDGALHSALRRLDADQVQVITTLAGDGRLVVIEGAAGTGKTTILRATAAALAARGHRLVVVTPTLKAAEVAATETGAAGHSASWLIHQHGWRWDDGGHWARSLPGELEPAARLDPGDLLLVDEAGMLAQDTAQALLTLADETGARVALVGDRHQLPAVGRGGVLDHALNFAHPTAVVTLETIHRFTDPDYAALSLQMRTGDDPAAVFDALARRGQIVLHASDVERTAALADAGAHGDLIIADTREQVANLNATIRDNQRRDRDPATVITTSAGERIGLGDRVATRRNDPGLQIANRQTWTVAGIGDGGGLLLEGPGGRGRDHVVPAEYAARFVELAYATTVHGAQGETVEAAHMLVGDQTGAAAAYVAMTRGREHNTAHLVAEDLEDALKQWVDVFSRERADLGPAHARGQAIDAIDRYGTDTRRRPAPPPPPAPSTQERGRGLTL